MGLIILSGPPMLPPQFTCRYYQQDYGYLDISPPKLLHKIVGCISFQLVLFTMWPTPLTQACSKLAPMRVVDSSLRIKTECLTSRFVSDVVSLLTVYPRGERPRD